MAGFVGADVQQLEALAKRFDRAADRLESMARESSTRLRTAQWIGADVDRLRADWDVQARPSIAAAASRLRDGARRLSREAAQQRNTSSASSGKLGTVSGVAGVIRGMSGGGGSRGDDEWGGGIFDDSHNPWVWGPDKSGSFDLFGSTVKGNAYAQAGAKGDADAYFEFDRDDGLQVGAFAEGRAGAWTGAGWGVENGPYSYYESYDVFAGVRGNLGLQYSAGPDGLSNRFAVDAFAGAELNATKRFQLGPFDLGLEGNVAAGAGVTAVSETVISWDEVRLRALGGVTWGIGFGGGGDIAFNPKEAALFIVAPGVYSSLDAMRERFGE